MQAGMLACMQDATSSQQPVDESPPDARRRHGAASPFSRRRSRRHAQRRPQQSPTRQSGAAAQRGLATRPNVAARILGRRGASHSGPPAPGIPQLGAASCCCATERKRKRRSGRAHLPAVLLKHRSLLDQLGDGKWRLQQSWFAASSPSLSLLAAAVRCAPLPYPKEICLLQAPQARPCEASVSCFVRSFSVQAPPERRLMSEALRIWPVAALISLQGAFGLCPAETCSPPANPTRSSTQWQEPNPVHIHSHKTHTPSRRDQPSGDAHLKSQTASSETQTLASLFG